MVKKEYVIKQMHSEGMNCFIIYDKDMNMVVRQSRNIGLKEAEDKLNEFFDAADQGLYTIKLYAFKDQGKTGQPVMGKYLHYDTHHLPSLKERDPLPPVPGYSGAGGFGSIHDQSINPWVDRFMGNKDQITELRIELEKDRIRNEYEARLREMEAAHKRELAERENTWEQRIMGIAQTVTPDLLKGFMGGKPINGISETQKTNTMTNTPNQDPKKRIIDAVNKLMSLDSNLAANLEKLAAMAEKSPSMYKQAVSILNSMG